MLYFKNDLIKFARNAVEAKETKDDVKALSYLIEIETILQHYNQAEEYNPIYADQLNRKIRKDYPLIDTLSNLPSNGNPQRDISNSKAYPVEINWLNVDYYGILVSVLINKMIIKDIKDALE